MRPPAIPQSHTRYPLSRILSSSASVRVLRVLLSSGQPLGVTLIAKQSGLSRKGTALVLQHLAGLQAIQAFGTSHAQLFQFNRKHPLAGTLEALFQAEQEQWTSLLKDLRHLVDEMPEVKAAWYYGSVARGGDTAGSDFDIAVLADDDSRVDDVTEQVRESLRALEERYLIVFSVVGLSERDVERLSAERAEWWVSSTGDARVLKGQLPQTSISKE